MKGMHLVFTWTTFLILFEPHHDVTESCYHGNPHTARHVRRNADTSYGEGNVDSQESGHSSGKEPNAEGSHYKPMRIKTVYSLSNYLLPEEKENLKRVLERAVRKITSTLSVLRSKDRLLLTRDHACRATFRTGINKGRCAKIQKGYSGEFCMDNLKIPTAHLEGFVVYNKTSSGPVKVYLKDGPGLKDTDFVLYVTSQTTALCNPLKSSALAYAAYCKMDETGRPVAGQVNFCPRTVKAQKFDEELLYKTSLHELFHALGFSNKLFGKFRNCDEVGNCTSWPKVFVLVDGIKRLGTDAVVREMQRHFNCTSEPDFGGPLEDVNGRVMSHWDPLLMHSSVMTSKEQKPYLMLIDPISLAVFEDSGWYKVDYSQADHFMWGKGKGCSFGAKGVCEDQEGFCRQNITGCHHLHLTKARCNANLSSTECGVFAADQRPCFRESIPSSEEEIFSSSSRCFVSTLSPLLSTSSSTGSLSTSGKCYERRCDGDKYFVRVSNSDWHLCAPGSHIQIPGFEGSVQCPTYEEVCTTFIHPEPPSVDSTTTRYSITTSAPSSEPGQKEGTKLVTVFLAIRLPSVNSSFISDLVQFLSESQGLWRLKEWAEHKVKDQQESFLCANFTAAEFAADSTSLERFVNRSIVSIEGATLYSTSAHSVPECQNSEKEGKTNSSSFSSTSLTFLWSIVVVISDYLFP
ncbi:leishmanolysin-like peptidase 2 [Aplysia californica]|uniref:Leishmanolysin-like peptidase n=1 Tax=Aplysia californica TaxID=6500 RepID=A0ABM0K7D9_APLCA|nr:leishmanolysin-like peptidase 2 [Aplysia californica]